MKRQERTSSTGSFTSFEPSHRHSDSRDFHARIRKVSNLWIPCAQRLPSFLVLLFVHNDTCDYDVLDIVLQNPDP